jgi:coenzyme Q-binding protein COQ10
MVKHHIQQPSPYTAQQLYALVMDVERYPEFIPWCKAARILTRTEESFLAELVISFKHIRESYVSRVQGDEADFTIAVVMERGPFHHLTNHWRFIPTETGCTIDFTIDFSFKYAMLEKIIGGLFSRATQKMVEAFSTRANTIYGTRHSLN